jgi:hypothetical protein
MRKKKIQTVPLTRVEVRAIAKAEAQFLLVARDAENTLKWAKRSLASAGRNAEWWSERTK